MRVILDHILVEEKLNEEKKTESGFLLPTDKVDWGTPIKAEVKAVGANVKEVAVGDVIYYLPKTGDSIVDASVVYRIIREADVIAIE